MKNQTLQINYAAAGLVLACIIVVGAFIGYQALTSGAGETDIYFNVTSQLPDPLAEVKYGRINSEGVNVIEVGGSYEVMFTVESKEREPTAYTLSVDSRIKSVEESFTLKPGERRTFTVTLQPTADDKWVFSHDELTSARSSYDLAGESWLGELVSFAVAAGEPEGVITYAPVSVNVNQYGDILNLNMSLKDLAAKPYRQEHAEATVGEYEKTVTASIMELYVKSNQLVYEEGVRKSVYLSEPETFKATVLNKGRGESKSISFWYKIK